MSDASPLKLAVMQPYLFPYLGYFQLAAAVDRFVFFDDVNFIRRGWIHRNRLLLSGAAAYFTVPLAGASQNLRICDIEITEGGKWKKKLEASLRQSYARAPHFEPVFGLVASVLFDGETRMAEMAKQSVREVARFLDLPTRFIASSSVFENQDMKGVARILDICRQSRATAYYNLPGGADLYDPGIFAAEGIDLRFIEPDLSPYPGHAGGFIPGLSIIDVLMHCDKASIKARLLGRH